RRPARRDQHSARHLAARPVERLVYSVSRIGHRFGGDDRPRHGRNAGKSAVREGAAGSRRFGLARVSRPRRRPSHGPMNIFASGFWARALNTAAGLWLMAAPAVLGHSDTLGASVDRVVGPLVASFAVIAM